MYKLEKKVKEIEKIKILEEQKKYILNLINICNYNKKINIINYILSCFQSKHDRLLQVQKYYLEKGKNKKIVKLNKEINELNELNLFLNCLKIDLIKTNKYNVKLNLSEEQIKKIDELINYDTYSLLLEINNIENSNEKIIIFNKLKEIYTLSLKKIRNNKEENYEYIRLIKILINYINDSIKLEHKKIEKNNKKIIKETDDSNNKLTNTQLKIIEDMKFNRNISMYDLKDILIAYKEFIINFTGNYPKNILMYSKEITNSIVSETIICDEIIILINSIKDAIKNKLLALDKENQEERKILKEIRIVFDFICKNYAEDKNKTRHDYRYDVINYFLQSEEGYPYLKKISSEMPNLVNVRCNNEHILIIILKEFIYNQKKMLEDKNSDYINPDYLKQVYILFSNSIYLKLTKEERKEIDELINKYVVYLKENVYKADRQKEMKKELNALRTENYFMTKKAKLKNVNKEQFIWQSHFMIYNKEDALNRHNRIDLSYEKPISFNDNTCYSIIETEKEKKLKISVLDLACIIPCNTSIDSQIYNDMMKQSDIDISMLKNLKFDYTKLNPTITYEISLNKINSVVDFNIYRSKTRVVKCNDKDLYFESNESLNKLIKLTCKLSKNNGISYDCINISNIERFLKQLLNNQLIQYLDKNSIPYIYSGIEYVNDYINNMNNLNLIFSRLDDKEFKEIYNLINCNVGEFGYSKEKFETEEPYELSILNKVNYLVLFNQRLIVDIIINNELIKTKKDYEKEIEELEHNLNLSIDHIRPSDMVFKNKRKRNKLKEYNYNY